jgi:plastocyanin
MQKMRKYLAIVTIAAAVILTAACSSSPSTAPATTVKPPVAPTSTTAASPVQPTPSPTIANTMITATPQPVPTSTPVISTSVTPIPTPTPVMSTTMTPVSTPTPTTPITAKPGAPTVTIDLVSLNLAFDKATLTVPAGSNVVINFNNKDSGIPHNVSVYQKNSDNTVKVIFIGDTINGPSTIVYRFVAPAAGNSYFFQCDVHPQLMVGNFVVTP